MIPIHHSSPVDCIRYRKYHDCWFAISGFPLWYCGMMIYFMLYRLSLHFWYYHRQWKNHDIEKTNTEKITDNDIICKSIRSWFTSERGFGLQSLCSSFYVSAISFLTVRAMAKIPTFILIAWRRDGLYIAFWFTDAESNYESWGQSLHSFLRLQSLSEGAATHSYSCFADSGNRWYIPFLP